MKENLYQKVGGFPQLILFSIYSMFIGCNETSKYNLERGAFSDFVVEQEYTKGDTTIQILSNEKNRSILKKFPVGTGEIPGYIEIQDLGKDGFADRVIEGRYALGNFKSTARNISDKEKRLREFR